MSKFKDKLLRGVIENLCKEGERIVRECENEREYEHDTHNLHDSYGYGVYYKGVLQKSDTLGATASEPRFWYKQPIWGYQEIERFLNSYDASNGIELVIVAAMPYAEVLENASSGQHRKYKVISMSFDKLKSLQDSYSSVGATVHRIVRGKKA